MIIFGAIDQNVRPGQVYNSDLFVTILIGEPAPTNLMTYFPFNFILNLPISVGVGNQNLSEVLDKKAKVLIDLFIDRQDACPTRKNHFCGTGILPVLFIFAFFSIVF